MVIAIFDKDFYYSNLKTKDLGRPCIYVPKTTSTIDDALKEKPNTLVLAGEQTKGRGQRSNVWHSPVGCAMGSVRLVSKNMTVLGSKVCFLQHMISIAAAETLEKINPQRLKDTLKLKWPNDLMYVEDPNKPPLKIGGVLVHMNHLGSQLDMTMSFGINLLNSSPTTCVRDIVGDTGDVKMESFVADLMNNLERYTYDLDESLFADLKSKYENKCLQINQKVQDEKHGTVKVRGVNDDGYLWGLRDGDGACITISNIVK